VLAASVLRAHDEREVVPGREVPAGADRSHATTTGVVRAPSRRGGICGLTCPAATMPPALCLTRETSTRIWKHPSIGVTCAPKYRTALRGPLAICSR